MATLVRRWRAPLLGGFAVWLLSLPLVTSHAAAPLKPVAARTVVTLGIQADLGVIANQMARERQVALTVSRVAAAAASPAATPVAAAASAARQLLPNPPRPAPATVAVRANNIVIPRLGLNQPVGWYSDCLGRAAVPRWGTWRWSCAGTNNIYVMAHNPGIFTPILGLRAGDIVKYGDPTGRVHTYRVSYTTIVSNTQLWPLAATSQSSLTLQTCWTWDGSRDFIVRAIEI
jgi:sortase (surface protein transpeptidase)